MLRGRGGAIVLAVALGIAAFVAWRAWGGEEAAIRRRLASLTTSVNAPAGRGLGAVAHAAEVGGYFTDDARIELGPGTTPIEGRTMLIGMATRLQPRLAAYELVIDDVGVELTGDTTADVQLTARFIKRSGPTEDSLDAREFALKMTRADGTWRISRLSVVQTLR